MSEPAASERAVLVTVALGSMLVPLNSTMIAVALPRLVDAFDTSLGSVSWLVTSYLIAMASLQPVAGKLGDRVGRRPMVLGGLAWFAGASAAAAAAPSLEVLIAFRVQQALAGALIVPNGVALLREAVPSGRLGSRLGLVGSALPLAAALGPPLGGLMLALDGWQGVFLVNLPLLLVPLVVGWRWIPARRRASGSAGFDLGGAALLCASLVALAWLLNGRGLSPPASAGLVAVVAASAGAFTWRELRHPDPVIDLRLFRRGPLSTASGAVALSNLAMYVTLLALPVLLSRREGWSSTGIGIAVAPAAFSFGAFALSPPGGRLSDRLGHRLPAAVGLGVMAMSLVPLALAPAELAGWLVVVSLLLSGAGLGLAGPGLQTAAVEAVGRSSAGVASGVYSTSRYLGSITGTSLLAGPLAPATHGAGGFGLLFSVLVAAASVAALLALALPGSSRASAALGSRSHGRQRD